MVSYFLFLLFPLLVVLGAAADALTMTIPDRLALALVGGFFLLAPVAGLGWASVGLHCAAAAVVLAGGFALFACGWIGGGDGKFAAAIALWLGWSHILAFVVAAAIFGGVLALAVPLLRSTTLPAALGVGPRLPCVGGAAAGLPYAVALSAAALLVYPHSLWIGLALG
jgi:prepilin peptidase CpaA